MIPLACEITLNSEAAARTAGEVSGPDTIREVLHLGVYDRDGGTLRLTATRRATWSPPTCSNERAV